MDLPLAVPRLFPRCPVDLAERLGCDSSDLGKWKRGEREPTLRTALRIAQLLGEPIAAIFWDLSHEA